MYSRTSRECMGFLGMYGDAMHPPLPKKKKKVRRKVRTWNPGAEGGYPIRFATEANLYL
jgi:hypothetical protein